MGRLDYVELFVDQANIDARLRPLLDDLTVRYGAPVEVKGSLDGEVVNFRSFRARFIDKQTGDRVVLMVMFFPDGTAAAVSYAPAATQAAP
jgi:hypothetical protein